MTSIHGMPIWFELTTTDRAAADAFYGAVVDWTIGVSPVAEHGGYGLATAPDGEQIAGIMEPPPGAPGGWSIYFGTSDLAATLDRARAAGGRVAFGPMDIPQVGAFAVVVDPQGVALHVLQPAAQEDARPFRQEDGALGHAVWVELATPDPDAAFAFYGALFGWTHEGAMPMGDMGDYVFFGAGGARPGAIMSSTATGAPPRWNSYFLVADIDVALEKVRSGGGTVIGGPDKIPGGDYSANIADPAGHALGLVGPRRSGG